MDRSLRVTARRFARSRFPKLMNQLRPFDRYQMYRYGITQSARAAKALGYPAMTSLELGVAGGAGLIAMEQIAAEVGNRVGIRIDVVGFDIGTGMPHATDYRDLPYIWQPGFYEMDVPALKARLTRAQLIIGDVAETAPHWMAGNPAPIGFIGWDLDYYSSTVAAMSGLLEAADERFIPRAFFYFDDIVGDHEELLCEYVGELLAIREFNDAHERRKIAAINGLRQKFEPPVRRKWPDQMFVFHLFDHPHYNTYIYSDPNRQLPM